MSSVTIAHPFQPDAERAALDDLVQSEGWQVYEAAMQARWSPARYEADIRAAMTEIKPGENVTDVVGQINATYAGMRAMLKWPQQRIADLSSATAKKPMLDSARDLFRRKRAEVGQ